MALLRGMVAMVMGILNQDEIPDEVLPVVEILHGECYWVEAYCHLKI